jgi:LysM domain-containing protein
MELVFTFSSLNSTAFAKQGNNSELFYSKICFRCSTALRHKNLKIHSRSCSRLRKINCRLASKEGIRSKLNAMHSAFVKSLPLLGVSVVFAVSLYAQTMPGKLTAPTRVESGLEAAIKWKWQVETSDDKDWGFASPSPTPSPPSAANSVATPENRPTLYEIKPGDALILIGKKFGVTVAQLKAFNGLKSDKIRAGQTLKIPTLVELSAMTPPPRKKKRAESSDSRAGPETAFELDKLRLQIFLDREQFSPGPIVVEPGPAFTKILLLYQSTHEDAKDDASINAKARAAVGNVFTRYKLKAEDFRFIAPPKAETVETKKVSISKNARHGKPAFHPPATATALHQTYEQLTAASMLAYRSPWEFVAERFHCQESYLLILNDKLPAVPAIGTEFKVPNVIPFEIERAFDEPIRPDADPKNPITAAVVGLAQLNIYQGGTLIAVFPMSPARPGLHGRGTWTILDLIPRPRLATFQEPRTEPASKPLPGPLDPSSPSPSRTVLSQKQYLAAGPRNPVGILWLNLAKSKSTEPLPYGLHGTSIPDQMFNQESIGGLRLTNWDIARAVHHLPFGTPLEWK